jgi:cyanophycinase-like exopeptidase
MRSAAHSDVTIHAGSKTKKKNDGIVGSRFTLPHIILSIIDCHFHKTAP